MSQQPKEDSPLRIHPLFAQMPAAIAVVEGPHHRFTMANALYQQLFNRTEEQLIGHTLREVFPEVEGQGIYELFDQVYQSGQPFTAAEFPAQFVRHGTGMSALGYFNFVAQPLQEAGGDVYGILIHAFEVTAQVHTRQQLAQNEARYRGLFEAIDQGFCLVEMIFDQEDRPLDYRFLEVNPVFEQQTGLEQATGKTARQLVPNLEQHWFDLYGRVALTGDPLHFTNGSEAMGRWFDVYAFRLGAPENRQVAILFTDITRRKQAEQALKESEDQLKFAIEATELATWDYNPLTDHFRGNTRLKAWFGLSAHDDIALPTAIAVISPSDQPRVTEAIARALQYDSGGLYEMIYTIVHPHTRRERIVRAKGKAWFNADHVAYRFNGTLQDITQERLAQQALAEREQQLRSALEGGQLGTYTYYPTTGRLRWSERTKALFGLPPEAEIDYARFMEGVHPEDRPDTDAAVQQALRPESGGLYEHEYRTVGLGDGQLRWIRSKGKVHFDPDGRPLWFTGITQDITPQKQAEAALKESEERFRVMADNIPNLAWMARADGWIFWYNRRWYDYTGTTPAQMEGWGWQSVHDPAVLPDVIHQWSASLAKGQPFQMVFPLKGADGVYRPFLTLIAPVRDEEGRIVRWFGSNTDISEQEASRQRLQALNEELAATTEELASANEELRVANEELGLSNEQLIRINQDLDNFIYTASHDLKAPISNIEGLMQALLRHLPADSLAPPRVQQIVGLIQDSVERFKKTITHLTDVVKLQKEYDQEEALVSMPDMIREVLLDLELMIQSSQANVTVDVEACPRIRFSEKNLRSLLYNLLSNALKYRSPHRTPLISIQCRTEAGYQVLTVADNGLGMKPEKLGQLFRMFKRFHDHVEGQGVGLYMVKKMVDNARGKITVESQVDQGTTFRVYLPA
ncbi:PAS domain S-box-containing protein [Catalinimonas alkaloidigena]|uniref:histidine kinase n=1 Tax=Catalinimonas alkaloidigena TaxID=1075417 RepID=A0A1G9HNE0_9BACT|nr:PAS domain S-box protein [Catalinimonas alkaloidigena]SDL14402.1 PAS domain S-box-containing protein [Catalinimonas alkaloidigena]